MPPINEETSRLDFSGNLADGGGTALAKAPPEIIEMQCFVESAAEFELSGCFAGIRFTGKQEQ